MLLTPLFWALFLLPGYALLRRFCPKELERGALHVLGFACAASFLLLSPVSILGYVLKLPLGVFSASVGLAIVWGVYACARRAVLRELAALVRSESLVGLVGLVLLAFLLWLQARLGAFMEGDAYVHVGRIRRLLQYGFENRDIYLAEPYFHHIYHTNLLYALYASLAQLTQQSYLDAWFFTQPFAKLLVASGSYSLGALLSGRRDVGWLVAIVVVTASSAESYSLYPNGLAVGFLLPMMLGVGFSLLSRSPEDRVTGKLFAGAFLLGQVHSLYALYVGMVLALPLLAQAVLLRVRRQSGRAPLLALVALLSALPFLWVSKYAFIPDAKSAAVGPRLAAEAVPLPLVTPKPAAAKPRVSTPPVSPAIAAGGGHLEKQLQTDGEGREVFRPAQMGGVAFVSLGLLSLFALSFVERERRPVWASVTLAALLLSAFLFVPILTASARVLLQAPFVVARLSSVLSLLLFSGLCAFVAHLWDRLPAARASRPVLLALAMLVATQLLGHAPRTFAEQLRAALEPRATRYLRLFDTHARERLLATHVPRGATVLASPRWARVIVMVCDCYVIAADRGHTHVPGISERRRDLALLESPKTPFRLRSALLARYGIHHVVYETRKQRSYAWAHRHGRRLGSAGGMEIVRLE